MTFDKSKIYTAINADEVKVGSKGYFADSINVLRKILEENANTDVLKKVADEGRTTYRFIKEREAYNLFYLVEEPKEEKYRPYENTDEMIEDFKNRICGFAYEGNLPNIWIKEKNSGDKYLISGFIKDDTNTYCVLIGTCFVSLEVLFKSYTYLDGSPCGKI